MEVKYLKEAGSISGKYLGVNNQNSGAVAMLTSIMMINVGDDT